MNNELKKNLISLFTKARKREERRNHHGSYKYPHSLHNVTAKQIDEKKEGAEEKQRKMRARWRAREGRNEGRRS